MKNHTIRKYRCNPSKSDLGEAFKKGLTPTTTKGSKNGFYQLIQEQYMEDALLTAQQIMAHFGISKATFYRQKRNDPHFPMEIALSTRTIHYKESDVLKWIESKTGM